MDEPENNRFTECMISLMECPKRKVDILSDIQEKAVRKVTHTRKFYKCPNPKCGKLYKQEPKRKTCKECGKRFYRTLGRPKIYYTCPKCDFQHRKKSKAIKNHKGLCFYVCSNCHEKIDNYFREKKKNVLIKQEIEFQTSQVIKKSTYKELGPFIKHLSQTNYICEVKKKELKDDIRFFDRMQGRYYDINFMEIFETWMNNILDCSSIPSSPTYSELRTNALADRTSYFILECLKNDAALRKELFGFEKWKLLFTQNGVFYLPFNYVYGFINFVFLLAIVQHRKEVALTEGRRTSEIDSFKEKIIDLVLSDSNKYNDEKIYDSFKSNEGNYYTDNGDGTFSEVKNGRLFLSKLKQEHERQTAIKEKMMAIKLSIGKELADAIALFFGYCFDFSNKEHKEGMVISRFYDFLDHGLYMDDLLEGQNPSETHQIIPMRNLFKLGLADRLNALIKM